MLVCLLNDAFQHGMMGRVEDQKDLGEPWEEGRRITFLDLAVRLLVETRDLCEI